MTLAAFIKLLICLESLLLGIWTVKRDGESRRSLLFAIYMFVIAIQAFVELELLQAETVTRFLFWKRFDVFIFIAVAVLFHFALEYSGSFKARSKRFVFPVYSMLGIAAVAQSTLAMGPTVETTPSGFEFVHSNLSMSFYMINVSTGVAFAFGTIYLFTKRLFSAENRQEGIQSAIMLFCMTFLVIAGASIEIAVMLGSISSHSMSAVTPFLVINPILAIAVFRYDVLDITPDAASADILKLMNDGLLLTDRKGAIRYANQALLNLFGYSAKEIFGKKLKELPIRSDNAIVELGPTVTESFEDWEGMFMAPAQRWIPISLSSTPFVRGRNIVGYIVTVRDISQRKKIEEIKQSVEKVMRHDLRNALSGILGFSELMRDAENLTDFQKQTVGIIYKSGQMMLRQIEGYLALQRMESGTLDIESLPADVLDLARDVKRNLQSIAQSQQVEIVITVGNTVPDENATLYFSTHPALFFGMLMNLVKNAIEASPPKKAVKVDLNSNKGLYIKIHNDLPIPKEIRNRFFEKFVTAKKKDGTGLGAYSAKLITESMGGTIKAESDELTGTDITVFFPVS